MGILTATAHAVRGPFFNSCVQNSVQNRLSRWISLALRIACTTCTYESAICFLRGFSFSALSVSKSSQKIRLDKLLVDRGLVPSRERAQALILAGKVLVDEQKIEKAGTPIESLAEIKVLGEDLKYVSRGGLKLERALEHWQIDVTGKICLDVGASTGGFTDCFLQRGAARVIAIDTGHGQIAFRLRQDARVRLLEKTNARYLTRKQIDENIDVIAVDVSFISATLVLPAVIASAFPQNPPDRSGRAAIVLVKPQFEAGRDKVGKGGIVRDPETQQQAVEKVQAAVVGLGAISIDVIESPILGSEGNREFLLYARF